VGGSLAQGDLDTIRHAFVDHLHALDYANLTIGWYQNYLRETVVCSSVAIEDWSIYSSTMWQYCCNAVIVDFSRGRCFELHCIAGSGFVASNRKRHQ
jgi:hypothetical protein